MKARPWMILALLASACTGCANMQGSQEYVEYREALDQMSGSEYRGMATRDFLHDFGDMFRWDVSAGEGIGIRVQPTELLQAGFIFADTAKIGWQERALGVWTEKRKEGGIGWNYYRDYVMKPIYGQPTLFDREVRHRGFDDFALRHNHEHHWLDIGLSVHLIFVGGGLYISPKEIFDFGFAIVNYPFALLRPNLVNYGLDPPELDFANDDTPAQLRKEMGLEIVPQQPGFEPAEKFNEWFELPY